MKIFKPTRNKIVFAVVLTFFPDLIEYLFLLINAWSGYKIDFFSLAVNFLYPFDAFNRIILLYVPVYIYSLAYILLNLLEWYIVICIISSLITKLKQQKKS